MSNYWLASVLDDIEKQYPKGEIVVSSGISPSASYHIGHLREILSADMIRVGLADRGRKARHIHVVDNFDPLRKRYDFLPESYEQYVGWPICLVPDPKDCHDSYAEHFFQEFYKWADKLDIEAEVVRSYEDLYSSGKMAPQIEAAIDKADVVRQVFKQVSNRELAEDWQPIQLLSESNNFNELRFKSIDTTKKVIIGVSEKGQEQIIDYTKGRTKLNWRLDWPARWQLLGVMVEPHGFQEHGASGGSFDTGRRFAKEVFGFEPPIAGFQYGHVHLAGDNIKMSSSKNNLVTPDQAFAIMPPEILRYFYARYSGKKRIDFDPHGGLINMYDEYVAVMRAHEAGEEHEFMAAYLLASRGEEASISSVPFSHLVNTYQAALGDFDELLKLLAASGYAQEAKTQPDRLKNELAYVKHWLENWAPERYKFELKKQLPDTNFSDTQKAFLSSLADAIEALPVSAEPPAFHALIHDLAKEHTLGQKAAFTTLYQLLLAQDSGPRAGWFLSIQDREFLLARLRLKG